MSMCMMTSTNNKGHDKAYKLKMNRWMKVGYNTIKITITITTVGYCCGVKVINITSF